MERVTRINDVKIELGRCHDDELYALLSDIAKKRIDLDRAEQAVTETLQNRHYILDSPLEEVA